MSSTSSRAPPCSAARPPTSSSRDGVIADVGRCRPPSATPTRRRRRRAGRCCPGLVDLHTHLREPGREDAETVAYRLGRGGGRRLHRGARDGQHLAGHRHRRGGRARARPRPGRRPGRRAAGRRGHQGPRRRGARRARADGPLARPGPRLLRRRPLRRTTPGSCAARWSTSRPSAASSPSTPRTRTLAGRDGLLPRGRAVRSARPARLARQSPRRPIVARDVMLARHTGSRVHVAHVSTAGTGRGRCAGPRRRASPSPPR